MATRNRHTIIPMGAVSAPGNSGQQDAAGYTSGILYLTGVGAVVTLEGSPDGGTTWALFHNAFDTVWTVTLGTPMEAHRIDQLPATFRLVVITADVTAAYMEGVRDLG